ncbi:MAG: dockerin type I repeat-containing protein [Muribaculaceae bacterium]|nr:dockerin type I repeat-containing protein [Muribaculaceae bacterium]
MAIKGLNINRLHLICTLSAILCWCGATGVTSINVPADGKFTINWYDYAPSGKGISYNSNFSNSFTNTNGSRCADPLPRTDVNGLAIVKVDNGGTFNGFSYPGTCLVAGTSTYTEATHSDNWLMPQSEAIERFGQWFDYVLIVKKECWAKINIFTAGSLQDASTSYNINRKNDSQGHSVEWLGEGQLWQRKYGQAFVLSLDKKDLPTHISSHPSIFKDQQYTYDVDLYDERWGTDLTLNNRNDLLMLLNDRERWISTLDENHELTDTLFTWPFDVYTGHNKWTPNTIPNVAKNLPDEYYAIHLTPGRHVLRVKKLAFAGNSWRCLFVTTQSEEPKEPILGDVNNDEIVDVSDIVLLSQYILDSSDVDYINLEVADVNFDNLIDVTDLVLIADKILGK